MNIVSRFKIIALSYGIDADDLIQDWYVMRLEGKAEKQTLKQFTFDWLRKNRGDKRCSTFEARKCLSNATSLDNITELIDENTEINYDSLEVREIFNILPENERVSLLLSLYGYTLNEIGFLLNYSAPTISLRIKSAKSKVREFCEF